MSKYDAPLDPGELALRLLVAALALALIFLIVRGW